MSSLFGIGGNGAASFYKGVATQSLKLDHASDTKLTRTPDAGNRKTNTLSLWLKRSTLGGNQHVARFTGGGNSDTGYLDIWFDANDKIEVAGHSTYFRITNRLFRDVSSWYHIVFAFDTTDSTADNRLKIYVNGVQETSFATNNAIGENADTGINANGLHTLGDGYGGFNGYFAEVNFIEGSQLTPSSFGETKNGVWIPKRYTGSYGTNGFRLQFAQVGVGTASTSTIGADTSGNTNHFTSSGIVASDCNMPDSPENNFCTLNINARGTTNVALSEGALKFVKSSANYGNGFSTFALFGGKWYFEGRMYSSSLSQIGVQEITNNIYTNSGDYGANTDLGMWDSRGYYLDEGTAGGSPPSYTSGDVINVAFDVDAGKIWFGKNGTYNHSGNPANGTNQTTGSTNDLSSIGVTPAGNGENGGGLWFNFGQDSTFGGAVSAGGNADGNGLGDFAYAPPSGFLAICTSNLPEPAIGPNSVTQAGDHFNQVLYTGNGQTAAQGSNVISGVGFQPDWVWVKKRDSGGANVDHVTFNSTMGINAALFPSTSGGEDTFSNQFKSFNSDGFTVALADDGSFGLNRNTSTFVSWNWKATGGTTSSNSDGSITSTVQANTDAGFSIVTATSPSSGTWSVGHGLSKKPDMVILKYRGSNSRWTTWHKILTSGQYFGLNESNGTRSAGTPFNFTITDSVIGGNADYDSTSQNAVYYVFHDVEGYSRFGSYTGNASTDGTFVYTGFRPAFLLVKNTATSNYWRMWVNDGDGNVEKNGVYPNASSPEDTPTNWYVDWLSNGFKARGSQSEMNGSGNTMIYMAFADAPFKYANAR